MIDDKTRHDFAQASEKPRDDKALPESYRQEIANIRQQAAEHRGVIHHEQLRRDKRAMEEACQKVLQERLKLDLQPRFARKIRLDADAIQRRARAIVDRNNEAELQRHDHETEICVQSVHDRASSDLATQAQEEHPDSGREGAPAESGREELLRLFEENSRGDSSQELEH